MEELAVVEDGEAAAAAAARAAAWTATARADHPATGSGAASAAATAPGCRAASSRVPRAPKSGAGLSKTFASRPSPAAAGRPSFSRDSRRPWLSIEQLSARDRRAEKRVLLLFSASADNRADRRRSTDAARRR